MNFKPAPVIENETERLKAVDRTGVMYLDQDDLYEIFCFLAKEITGCSLSWTNRRIHLIEVYNYPFLNNV